MCGVQQACERTLNALIRFPSFRDLDSDPEPMVRPARTERFPLVRLAVRLADCFLERWLCVPRRGPDGELDRRVGICAIVEMQRRQILRGIVTSLGNLSASPRCSQHRVPP